MPRCPRFRLLCIFSAFSFSLLWRTRTRRSSLCPSVHVYVRIRTCVHKVCMHTDAVVYMYLCVCV